MQRSCCSLNAIVNGLIAHVHWGKAAQLFAANQPPHLIIHNFIVPVQHFIVAEQLPYHSYKNWQLLKLISNRQRLWVYRLIIRSPKMGTTLFTWERLYFRSTIGTNEEALYVIDALCHHLSRKYGYVSSVSFWCFHNMAYFWICIL